MWSLPDRRLLWSRDDVPTSYLAVSPDGRYLSTLGFTPADALPDGAPLQSTLTIWDLASRTPVLVDDFSDRPVNSPVPKPRSVVYSPDSTKLAASFDDDLIRVYDVSTLSRTPVARGAGSGGGGDKQFGDARGLLAEEPVVGSDLYDIGAD